MKNTVSLILVISLCFSLSSAIGLTGNVIANPSFNPEDPPSGYVINADGTFCGEKLKRDGDTYILTGNIHSAIVINRNGIVLDGAGYSVQGSGYSAGVWFRYINGLTIKNLKISNFTYGIKFVADFGSGTKVEACKIIGNELTNNTYGISLGSAVGCTFRNNYFEDNSYAFLIDGYRDNDFDASNTIEGKPIYYWINKHDATVPPNAGAVILKNCINIQVENQDLKGLENGIMLINTNSSSIKVNTIYENQNGIYLRNSVNNIISGNFISNNRNTGIAIGSEDNLVDGPSWKNTVTNNKVIGNVWGISCTEKAVISGNQVIANKESGISTRSSSTISNNNISENGGNAIFVKDIKDSNIVKNNITSNKGYGIGFGYGPNGKVEENIILRNNGGIWISNAYSNTIQSNVVIENERYGVYLEGSHRDNLIYHNNFIGNNKGDTQATIKQVWFYPDAEHGYHGNNPPQLVDGAANSWDNGKEGNYWSDHTSGGPYHIDSNNQDNHPLSKPLEFPGVVLPSIQPPPVQPTPKATDLGSGITAMPEQVGTIGLSIAILAVALIVASICLICIKKRKKAKVTMNFS